MGESNPATPGVQSQMSAMERTEPWKPKFYNIKQLPMQLPATYKLKKKKLTRGDLKNIFCI